MRSPIIEGYAPRAVARTSREATCTGSDEISHTSFMTPALNKPVPEFEALATGGVKFTPQAYAGKIVVLYFYPKDNTPGCTTEAMQFRDHYKDFVKAGAVLFGVSRDNMASHDRFKANLELPFELIADTEEKLCHMFGVVKNKIMYGKKVKGIERSTFLIDAQRRVAQRVARPDGQWPRRGSAESRQGDQEGRLTLSPRRASRATRRRIAFHFPRRRSPARCSIDRDFHAPAQASGQARRFPEP